VREANNLIFSRPTTAGLQHKIPLFYLPVLLVQPSISTLRVSKALQGALLTIISRNAVLPRKIHAHFVDAVQHAGAGDRRRRGQPGQQASNQDANGECFNSNFASTVRMCNRCEHRVIFQKNARSAGKGLRGEKERRSHFHAVCMSLGTVRTSAATTRVASSETSHIQYFLKRPLNSFLFSRYNDYPASRRC